MIKERFGCSVCFLGPDGCGKSSVIDGIWDALDRFSGTAYFHFRPDFGKEADRDSPPSPAPQNQIPRSPVGSLIKLLYYWFDYQVGYRIIRKKVKRGQLVIFDRYLHDLVVDQLRYRYGGPQWAIRLICRLVPLPDLVICLDAPAEVLQARKKEVSFEETARQREVYRQLIPRLKNGVVVNADQPLEQVVSEVKKLILAS